MRLSILGASAIAASTWAFAQEATPPQLTYRSGIDLVQVDVSVLDKDRRPVRGLKAGDFVVREDGKVRAIAAFSAVTLPPRPPELPPAWMREVGPDVVTNLAPKEGRLVVILLDYSIRHSDIPEARRTAAAAIDQLGPDDLAAVIYTSVGVPQNFTTDRSLLRAAINQPFLGIDVDPDDPFGAHRGECRCGLCSLETMTNVADAVREVPHRRKMLLFIGSGVAVSTTGIECFAEVREAREKLLRAAGAANLTIHSFDSMLLQSGGSSSASDRGGIPDVTDASARSRSPNRQLNLAFYPGETGGRAIKNTNAPWEPLPDIFAETDSYYVLGIVPSSSKNDGAYHAISVDVNLLGVEVHPRKGYYAPVPPTRDTTTASNGGAPASLTAALSHLWPETQIPMSVTAAAFAATAGPGATVAVVARAQEPAVPERGGQVNVLAGAYGGEGEPLARQVQTIRMRPSPAGQKVSQYEVPCRLQLKPGRHEVRVAVEDPERHLTGSVYTYVHVPDFAKEPLSLSGLVLGTRATTPNSAFADLLPLEPTTRREFAATDHVTVFARVYQAPSDAAIAVTVSARITDASNRTAYEASTSFTEKDSAGRHSADYRLELPLASLTAGRYLLTIEATRKAKQTVRRDVMFSMR